jgi:nucleoside-diphosphate-sugar epimerase
VSRDGVTVVTGASGFVGSHLLTSLVGLGIHTRAVLRATSDARWLPTNVDRATASLEDEAALRTAVRGASIVFHLAAVTSSARESDYTRANVDGTRRVLEAVHSEAPSARVVLCSSLAAVGAARGHALTEDDDPRPVSPYGRSKLAAERVADDYVRAHALDVVIVRPTAVYGPRDRDILEAFRLAQRGLALRIAPVNQRLTMIHARDLATALILAARAGHRESGRARRYHVSDGVTYSWDAVIESIGDAIGRRPRAIPVPRFAATIAASLQMAVSLVRRNRPLLTHGRIAELAAADWSCDISRARSELGFAPTVRLSEGMRETAAWYKEQGWLRSTHAAKSSAG